MKKPALIETTVRLFPDKDFDAATTRTTAKGHVTGRLYHSVLKRKKLMVSIVFLKCSLYEFSSIPLLC